MGSSLNRSVALVVLLAAATLALTGCFAFTRVESTARTKSETIPMDGTEELEARFTMPLGVLKVDGDTDELAEMEFRSASPEWLPVVESDRSQGASGTVTRIEVAVPDGPSVLRGTRGYAWDAHLSGEVPSDLRFELGAGESRIDLTEVDVRDLHVTTGVGETQLDLSGDRVSDVNARVECGIGEVKIRVPADVGVEVSGRGEGLGDLSADGFTLSGDQLTTEAWATSQVKIRIWLTRGVGDVRIETVE